MIIKEIDFDNIIMEKTPYEGIYVSSLDEENPSIPKVTAHVVRIDPNCKIELHYHEREDDWTEIIIFPFGGNFEILIGIDNSRSFSGKKAVYARVNSKEIYGIINRDSDKPLFLLSIMKPGFLGYKEIKSL